MASTRSAPRVLLTSVAICLVCSLVVSLAALYLAPLHRENVAREQRRHMLEILESHPGLAALLRGGETVELETRLVELSSGHVLRDADGAGFDQGAAAKDPVQSVALPSERDMAGIGRRAKRALVYEVRHGWRLAMLILPIHGQGYGGLMYGYLALGADANTILGITFYKHEETPGIGGDIEEADWRDLWRGKRLRDEEGRVAIRVIEEDVPSSLDPLYRVDAIGGATRTSQGVANMVRFWMGDDGFGPYLRRAVP